MEKLLYLMANQSKRLREEERGFFASHKREEERGGYCSRLLFISNNSLYISKL
jgi:hypothetical protein